LVMVLMLVFLLLGEACLVEVVSFGFDRSFCLSMVWRLVMKLLCIFVGFLQLLNFGLHFGEFAFGLG